MANEDLFNGFKEEIEKELGEGEGLQKMMERAGHVDDFIERRRRKLRFYVPVKEMVLEEVLGDLAEELKELDLGKPDRENIEKIKALVEEHNSKFKEASEQRRQMGRIYSAEELRKMEEERKEVEKRRERAAFIKEEVKVMVELIEEGDMVLQYDFLPYFQKELKERGMELLRRREYEDILRKLQFAEKKRVEAGNLTDDDRSIKEKVSFRRIFNSLKEKKSVLENFMASYPVGSRVKKGQWGAKEDGVVWRFVEIDLGLVGEDEGIDAYQQMYGGIVYVVTGLDERGRLLGYKFRPKEVGVGERGEEVVYERRALVEKCKSEETALVINEEGGRLGKIDEVGPNGRYVKVVLFDEGGEGGERKAEKRWYDFERLYEDNKQVLG